MSPAIQSETAVPQTETGQSSAFSTPSPKKASKTVSKLKTTFKKQIKENTLTKRQESADAIVKELLKTDEQTWGRSLQQILDYAFYIKNAAKQLDGRYKDLNNKPWLEFVRRCKSGKTGCSMYRTIAAHKDITNPDNFKCLPASASTLYQLAINPKLIAFAKACKSGVINPSMTRDDASQSGGKKPTNPLPKGKTAKPAGKAKADALAQADAEDHMGPARHIDAVHTTPPLLPAPRHETTAADLMTNALKGTVYEREPGPDYRLVDSKMPLRQPSELDDANFRSDLYGLPEKDLDLVNGEILNMKHILPKVNGKVWVLLLVNDSAFTEVA
jgi:hypothetical protein